MSKVEVAPLRCPAFSAAPPIPTNPRYSNRSFRLMIPDADRRAIAYAEAIGAFGHLLVHRGGRPFSNLCPSLSV
jgi:hypothetical protein